MLVVKTSVVIKLHTLILNLIYNIKLVESISQKSRSLGYNLVVLAYEKRAVFIL
jgi:hypothetical protein